MSNIVIVEKKNGSLRLCLDPKPLNEAIKCKRHNIPTPADVQSQLSGKTILTGTLSSATSRRTIVRLTHRRVESDFYACPLVFHQQAKSCKSETKRRSVT